METLEITRTAVEGARALGYSLEDIVEAVQELEAGDFIKSETAHNPPNSKVSWAVADGVTAGTAAHRALVFG